VRDLYRQIGKEDVWARYVAGLREQHRGLPALKEEMSKARLRAPAVSTACRG
jgi:hypothetical protein